MSIKDFLDAQTELSKRPNMDNDFLAVNLKIEELSHEYGHYVRWAKEGIKSAFYRNKEGDPYTKPYEEDLKHYLESKEPSKEEFLNLLLEVVTWPSIMGQSLGETDKIQRDVLLKRIRSLEELNSQRMVNSKEI